MKSHFEISEDELKQIILAHLNLDKAAIEFAGTAFLEAPSLRNLTAIVQAEVDSPAHNAGTTVTTRKG